MIFFAWNYRGIGQSTTIQSLQEYNRSHQPAVMFLSEIKSYKTDYVNSLATILGFMEGGV